MASKFDDSVPTGTGGAYGVNGPNGVDPSRSIMYYWAKYK